VEDVREYNVGGFCEKNSTLLPLHSLTLNYTVQATEILIHLLLSLNLIVTPKCSTNSTTISCVLHLGLIMDVCRFVQSNPEESV